MRLKQRHFAVLMIVAFAIFAAIAIRPMAGLFMLVAFGARELYDWVETRNDVDAARREIEEDGGVPLPCPACGFMTLTDRYGTFLTCPICRWQDDPGQLANPVSTDGANARSLAAAQAETALRFSRRKRHFRGHDRSDCWRPLTAEEVERAGRPEGERAPVLREADAYWMAGRDE